MAGQLAPFRICTVDGCHRQSYVPGSGKGMCGPHYQKWRTYGDPLADRRRQRNPCSVDGCTRWCVTQGICGTHAWRMRTHGTVTPRLQGQVVDGKRICPGCREDKPVSEFGGSHCRPCAARRAKERRAVKPVPRRPALNLTCRICAADFMGHKQRAFCSRACQRTGKIVQDRAYEWDPIRRAEVGRRYRQKHPDKNWAKSAAYRARKKTATVEQVDRDEIFARDAWCCQLCHEPIDRNSAWPDPLSPSIDHRVPLAAGGEHSMANCQAAHLGCNVRKGASIEELRVGV